MESVTLLEPLQFFEQVGRDRQHQNVLEYFEQLLKQSGVDAQENKETVEAYRKQLEEGENTQKKISRFKWARTGLIFLIVIGAILILVGSAGGLDLGPMILLNAGGIAAIVLAIVLLVKKVNPALRNVEALLAEEMKKAEELLQKAWEQMAPLNALFDDADTKTILQKTFPEMKIDPCYTAERHREFVSKYDYDESEDENENISTVNTLSGTLFNNPFVFERYLNHEIVEETYEGRLTIYWTVTYTDSDGNVIRERRSQELVATVEKPKPLYTYKTQLRYGHQGAPDLTFTRTFDHVEKLTEKALEKKIKAGEKALQKKARASIKEGTQFTEMTNAKFDVLFGATDRDNEVQFRMMFTPLAQTEMVKLLCSTVGFGDEFEICKKKRTNYLMSEHGQSWDMDTSPDKFYSYDLEDTKAKFVAFNDAYYKSVFFDFAPFMSIPMYQQKPIKALETPDGASPNYTMQEYEVLANCLNPSLVAHSKTETRAIVKASFENKNGAVDKVHLTAYSYRTEERVDYVSVLGGDGNYHKVPVPWIEYIPLTKTTTMAMRSLDCSDHQFSNRAEERYGSRVTNIAERSAFTHGLYAYLFEPKETFDSTLSKLSFLDTELMERKENG